MSEKIYNIGVQHSHNWINCVEHARLSEMSSHSASPSPNQDKVIDRSGLHRLFLCKIFKSAGQFYEQIDEDYGSYLFNEAEN